MTDERFATLSKGLTQFTIMPEPFLTQAERLGFRNLYNLSDLKIPYPTPAGVKTTRDDLAPKNPKAAGADPKAFVDPSLIKKIESFHFIKQLYK